MRLIDRIVAIIAPPASSREEPPPGAPPPGSRAPHALFVYIPTSGAATENAPKGVRAGPVDLRVLQERLSRAMTLQHAGRFEGVEPADSGVTLVFSGPNTDRLATVALPLLRAAALPRGTVVTRRWGGPGARSAQTPIGR